MNKTVVDVERIRAALAVLAEFDSLDIREVELRIGGEPVAMSEKHLECWRFMGLCNRTLVEMEWWNEPESELASW